MVLIMTMGYVDMGCFSFGIRVFGGTHRSVTRLHAYTLVADLEMGIKAGNSSWWDFSCCHVPLRAKFRCNLAAEVCCQLPEPLIS